MTFDLKEILFIRKCQLCDFPDFGALQVGIRAKSFCELGILKPKLKLKMGPKIRDVSTGSFMPRSKVSFVLK